MATITLRSVKGTPLTNNEIDGNFTNINNELTGKLNSTSYTASDVLDKIKTVDGTGSGLDADLLDGLNSASSSLVASVVTRDSSGNFTANQITATTHVGSLYLNTADNITFEGSVADGFETTLTVANPTDDRTITLPNVTGTVVTTGDTSTVTNTMLAGSIANAKLTNSSVTIDGNTVSLGASITPGFGAVSGNNTWTGTQTFRDNRFLITDDVDTTKVMALQLSNIATGTTRTLTVPNESGIIATQGYVQTSGQNSQGTKTISTAAPSGGSAGDIWYRI